VAILHIVYLAFENGGSANGAHGQLRDKDVLTKELKRFSNKPVTVEGCTGWKIARNNIAEEIYGDVMGVGTGIWGVQVLGSTPERNELGHTITHDPNQENGMLCSRKGEHLFKTASSTSVRTLLKGRSKAA
jgi:hypothetical protein